MTYWIARVLGWVVFVAAAVLIPIAGLWALNTLFDLHLAYTFENWLAMVFLQLWMGCIGLMSSGKI